MRRKYKLYGLTGLAYFGLWLAIDLLSQHPPFGATLVNSTWLALYITAVNYLFFERFDSRLLLYPVAIVLLTAGLYGWRLLGISCFIYTPLKSFAVLAGMIYVAPHGLLSLLFFGLIKRQYAYVKLKQTVAQLQSPRDEHLIITVQKKKVRLLFADILYIESQREYVRIVTSEQPYLTKMSTQEIEKLLPAGQFKRVHRSFIVALNQVNAYTAESLEIRGTRIPVGRAYRSGF